jgi:hypothetical protein
MIGGIGSGRDRMKRLAVFAFAAALVAVTPVAAQEVNDAAGLMRSLGGGLAGKKLKKAIEKAEASPLGSRENPVRADMPVGQRAYLQRLRCADGQAPSFARSGSVGDGPYGYMLDLYKATCAGAAPVDIYMDMYHRNVELRPIPGFTIAVGS